MTDRAALLHQHVQSVEGKDVAWGADDCTAWCAAWVKLATGRDVPFLASYSSIEEAHAVIDAAGGLDVLWGQALASASIYSTPYDPVLGDVGIVETASFGKVGVIFAQDGIALWRALRGTAMLRPRRQTIVKVWRLP